MTRFTSGVIATLILGSFLRHAESQSPCDGPIVVEASLPYMAAVGDVNRVVVDGESVWVLQGQTALRFQKLAGEWVPTSTFFNSQQTFLRQFDVHSPVLYSVSTLYEQHPVSGAWMQVGSTTAVGGEYSIGSRLGDFFVVVAAGNGPIYWDSYNWSIRPTSNPTASLGLYPPTNGSGAKNLAAGGNRFAIAISMDTAPIQNLVKVWVGTVSGNSDSISLPSTVLLQTPTNAATLVCDLDISNAFVALTSISYNLPQGSNYRLCVHDGAMWSVIALSSQYSKYVAASESAVYATGTLSESSTFGIKEYVRPPSGEMVLARELPLWPDGPLAAGETLLATTVASTTSPSGHELVIMRTHPVADCDGDGILDCEELGSGASEDVNRDSIPDECQCIQEISGDGIVNGADLGILLSQWGAIGSASADINHDGIVNGADIGLMLGGWGPCPN